MAYLTGDQASFTFGGQAIVVADFDYWSWNEEKPPRRFRPFGWTRATTVFATPRSEGELRMGVNDTNAAPLIPDGTRGTLVLFHKTAATAIKYTLKASLYSLGTAADSTEGAQQFTRYRWVDNASASTDTITPSP